ncbi:MAG: dynamin family protein [Verrucomicrobia bacterium]|nr:dynamin family protein [Verrucomicrobiota bacterium]
MVQLLKEFQFLIQESFLPQAKTASQVPPQVTRAMEADVLPRLSKLRARAQCLGQRYAVAVVGLSNAGKSTLLNALLGRELAPTINGPCTSAVVEFVFGKETIIHSRPPDRLAKDTPCQTTEIARRTLERLASGETAGATSPLHRIIVSTPAEILRKGLVLVDTPGFGAALDTGHPHAHDTILKCYLTTELAQVFWVVNAKRGITDLDMGFYREYLSDRCDDLIVTRSDYFRQPGSKEEFQKLYMPLFDSAPPLFHFVSGQSACDDLANHKLPADVLRQRLEDAGIRALEDRIRALRDEVGQRHVLETHLRDLATKIGSFLREFRDIHGRCLKQTWKPSLWENAWRNAADPFRRELATLMAVSNHCVTRTP